MDWIYTALFLVTIYLRTLFFDDKCTKDIFTFKMQLILSLKSNKYLSTSVDSATNQRLLCFCIPPIKALARIEVNRAGSAHNNNNNVHHHNYKNRQSISTSSSVATEHR